MYLNMNNAIAYKSSKQLNQSLTLPYSMKTFKSNTLYTTVYVYNNTEKKIIIIICK